MNRQMTLEEFGVSLKDPEAAAGNTFNRAAYVSPCAGCICSHCANSVECTDKCTGEAETGCFDCDECRNYGWEGAGSCKDNWKQQCPRYRVTKAHADRLRRKFRAVKGGKGQPPVEDENLKKSGGEGHAEACHDKY